MAEVPVTINGVIFPKARGGNDQPIPCTLVGSAWITGLGLGGGPVLPDQPPGQGGQPIHPIWGPPGFNPPGAGMPPGIWGGPVLPPDAPPDVPAGTPPSSVVKEPTAGGWGYYTDANSVLYAAYRPDAGSAGPKR